MKPVEIIRLGIIAIALLLLYQGILAMVGLISIIGSGGPGFLGLFLRAIFLFAAFYVLIRNSRRISNFVEESEGK